MAQMKTLKFASEIKWPLPQKTFNAIFSIQILMNTLFYYSIYL